MAEWWNGGMAEWWNGGIAEWWNGSRMAREWRYGGKNDRITEWQKWLHTYYLRYTHTDDNDDDDDAL